MWKAKSQIDTTENSQIPQLISFSIVIIRVQGFDLSCGFKSVRIQVDMA